MEYVDDHTNYNGNNKKKLIIKSCGVDLFNRSRTSTNAVGESLHSYITCLHFIILHWHYTCHFKKENLYDFEWVPLRVLELIILQRFIILIECDRCIVSRMLFAKLIWLLNHYSVVPNLYLFAFISWITYRFPDFWVVSKFIFNK